MFRLIARQCQAAGNGKTLDLFDTTFLSRLPARRCPRAHPATTTATSRNGAPDVAGPSQTPAVPVRAPHRTWHDHPRLAASWPDNQSATALKSARFCQTGTDHAFHTGGPAVVAPVAASPAYQRSALARTSSASSVRPPNGPDPCQALRNIRRSRHPDHIGEGTTVPSRPAPLPGAVPSSFGKGFRGLCIQHRISMWPMPDRRDEPNRRSATALRLPIPIPALASPGLACGQGR